MPSSFPVQFLLAFLLVATPASAAPRKHLRIPASAPTGFVKPTESRLSEALDLVEKHDPEAALTLLGALSPASPPERLWKTYAEGLALYEEKKLDDGYRKFLSIYEETRATKTGIEPDTFRLLGAALKKTGWFWREKKEFEKAYAFHQIELSYYEKYGSPAEIHDACISLDVDSNGLKDVRMSEHWLRLSLAAAHKIAAPQGRMRALAMSYNNLAEPLYDQQRFAEAEQSILLSLKLWKQWEKENGTKELRVLWAYFGVGDVYETWARFLKNSGQAYARQKALALANYRKCLALADQQGLGADDRKSIADTITALESLF